MKNYTLLLILFFLSISFIYGSTIAHWRFQNNLSSEVGGSNLVGTAYGSVSYSSDSPYGAGSSMDFSGGHVRMLSTTNITGGLNALTVEAFIKPNTANQFGTIYSEDMSYEPRSTFLGYMGTSNAIRFFVNVGSEFEVLDAPVPNLSGAWHHIAAVFDGATKTSSIYLDGVLLLSRSLSISTIAISPVNPSIGVWSSSMAHYNFDGKIAEVRLSDQALSPSQFLNVVPELPTHSFLTFAFLFISIISMTMRKQK